MSAPDRPGVRGYLLFLASVALTTVVLAAAGYVPTRSLGGRHAVVAMVAACGISAVASMASGVPLALARRGELSGMRNLMLSMLLRLLVVAALAVSIGLGFELPTKAFLIWLVASYSALLAVDTVFALKALGSL